MIEGYKRRLALGYVANTAARLPYRTEYRKKFLEGLEEFVKDLCLVETLAKSPKLFACKDDKVGNLTDEDWAKICEILRQEEQKTLSAEPDFLERRIIKLSGDLGFDETDISILLLSFYCETDVIMDNVIDMLAGVTQEKHNRGFRSREPTVLYSYTADMLGLSRSQLRMRLAGESLLIQSGMLSVDEDGDISMLSRLKRLTLEPAGSDKPIPQILFDKTSTAELEWQDFAHVATERDHIERLTAGALSVGGKGVNILIHGPPGSGKTEFCKTLAAHLGVDLYTVAEVNQYGKDPNRRERLDELQLAERLLAKSQNSVLLFDEMEDILSGRLDRPYREWRYPGGEIEAEGGHGSRVFMHRMLERNAVPTIWTSNSAAFTHHGILRRMMYVFELRQPPRKIRTRIWGRVLERHGLEFTTEDTESLSRDFEVTPGVVDRAVASASLIEGGDISTVREGVKSLSRVLSGPKAPEVEPGIFDPSLVCANRDLIELSDQLEGLDSVCT